MAAGREEAGKPSGQYKKKCHVLLNFIQQRASYVLQGDWYLGEVPQRFREKYAATSNATLARTDCIGRFRCILRTVFHNNIKHKSKIKM